METVTLREYADSLFGGEDAVLHTMRREAEEQDIPAIQVPTDLARLLALLIAQSKARRILEVGTLFGYSSVVMARAMGGDGRLITLEVNPRHAQIAERNLRQANLSEHVTVLLGPALNTLQSLRGQVFDLVFIDADKDSYPAYLQHVLELTHSGSIIVADNVWRQGAVAAADSDDPSSRALAAFNRALAAESRLVSTIVPTRNGEDAASISLVR